MYLHNNIKYGEECLGVAFRIRYINKTTLVYLRDAVVYKCLPLSS